ncbi:MAG: diphthamide biosynthesis enzyme Dph2 [Methanobacteriota archaeon]|nr:MAG: diphthamide biosynthesis enzyme Dph2 [Euryarchaeota archaeon]
MGTVKRTTARLVQRKVVVCGRIIMYDIDLTNAVAEIKRLKARIVALQVPEGMKKRAYQIAEDIENNASAEVMLVAEPCFGACDVPSSLFDMVDAVVHVGHSPIPSLRFTKPVIFVPARSRIPVTEQLKKAVGLLVEPVGVLATSQHLEELDDAIEGLESMGMKVKIGEGDSRISHVGEILGCNYTTATSIAEDVNSYLLIGSGTFHGLGVHLSTGKKVVVLDPNLEEPREIEQEKAKILRQRHAAIERAEKARSFGIIIGEKVGQRRLRRARELRKLIRWKRKDASLILMDKFDPEKLKTLGFDAYVSTACPRIAIDDVAMYDRPLLTPHELEIVLGVRRWDDYTFDQMTEEEF